MISKTNEQLYSLKTINLTSYNRTVNKILNSKDNVGKFIIQLLGKLDIRKYLNKIQFSIEGTLYNWDIVNVGGNCHREI